MNVVNLGVVSIQQINELAKDTQNIKYKPDPKLRRTMKQHGITIRQIHECLLHGISINNPDTDGNNQEITISCLSCGDHFSLRVAVANEKITILEVYG